MKKTPTPITKSTAATLIITIAALNDAPVVTVPAVQPIEAGEDLDQAITGLSVADVDALHRAFSAAGVPIEQPPHDTDWGSREMLIVDPDGNRLRFATDAG